MGKFIDLTGQKFGRWTVLKLSEKKHNSSAKYWVCKCECGTIREVNGSQLRNGNSKSCGCLQKEISKNKIPYNYKDLTGQRFGKLVVLERDESKKDRVYWKCKCDCGNITSVIASNLKSEKTKSCGCSQNIGGQKNLKDLTGQRFGFLTVIKRFIPPEKEKETFWECECACGNITIVRGGNLTSGNTTSCGCTNISHGEQKILSILEENDINYIHQSKNKDCISYITGRKLIFDFYLPDYKCYIEYDGEQHYEISKNPFFQDNEAKYERRKINDDIKTKFCEKNGYNLIRIPYTRLKDLSLDDLIPTKNNIYVVNFINNY